MGSLDSPEEDKETLEDVAEVVVPLDGGGGVHGEAAKHLHPDDRVDEEEDAHQQTDIGKGLGERLVL